LRLDSTNIRLRMKKNCIMKNIFYTWGMKCERKNHLFCKMREKIGNQTINCALLCERPLTTSLLVLIYMFSRKNVLFLFFFIKILMKLTLSSVSSIFLFLCTLLLAILRGSSKSTAFSQYFKNCERF
jgi:hypothetical protein